MYMVLRILAPRTVQFLTDAKDSIKALVADALASDLVVQENDGSEGSVGAKSVRFNFLQVQSVVNFVLGISNNP